MSLPDFLNQLITRTLSQMHEDPRHEVPLGQRIAIYSLLGPRSDLPDAPDLIGYRRRVYLEILTAQRVLPIWESALPKIDIPHRLIDLAVKVADQHLSVTEAWRLRDELLATMPNANWPLRGVLAAAGDALRTAAIDIDFDPIKPDLTLSDEDDLEEEGGYRDAAGWGAFVTAGGTTQDASSDVSKREEFWEWWLTTAISQAYLSVR